jgi:transcriptional regulator with XRE-family HTH domain
MQRTSPEIVKLMDDAITHKQATARKKLTSRDIAKQLGISDQRFSTYANGSRIPRPVFAKTLARYFFKTDKERARFMAALHTIRAGIHDAARRNARSSFVERLARGEALRVSEFEMEPFAGRHDDFFDQVFDRFFRLSGLTTAHIPQPRLNITDVLWDDMADLYISCIASVNSSILANFWTTPIRLSLAAIIHSKHDREKEKVKRVLTLQEHKSHYITCSQS